MNWIIQRIDDADFGCEERMPGEPLMALVTLKCEDERIIQLEVADDWLTRCNLSEGDEWPEDIEAYDESIERYIKRCNKQADFMDNFLSELEELV